MAVTCPLAVAEQRERLRSNEDGLARGHFHAVHHHGGRYDLVVGTTGYRPPNLREPCCDVSSSAGRGCPDAGAATT
ncbi:hypothetical protein ACFYV7_26260 [Nocardia suismassiliense]|uniref:Uncharacterized protein n=1 Tax=Nocardia suismassiliense TaxID=2077092 RepID=A0ABW6QZP1_9NOCA